MIITQSVCNLINELCSTLTAERKEFQTFNSKQLKTLKCRAYEFLLRNSIPAAVDQNELYFHEFELTIKGASDSRRSAMKECCRLVERDEYFHSENGQNVLAFLLKLRNSAKSVNNNQVR